MAWNTHRLQAVIDLAPSERVDGVSSRMAPIGHEYIDLRGILKFDFAQHAAGLLRQTPVINNERVSKWKADFPTMPARYRRAVAAEH